MCQGLCTTYPHTARVPQTAAPSCYNITEATASGVQGVEAPRKEQEELGVSWVHMVAALCRTQMLLFSAAICGIFSVHTPPVLLLR